MTGQAPQDVTRASTIHDRSEPRLDRHGTTLARRRHVRCGFTAPLSPGCARRPADDRHAGVGTAQRRATGGACPGRGARCASPAVRQPHQLAAAAAARASAAYAGAGRQAATRRAGQTGAAAAGPDQGQQQRPADPALRVAAPGAGEPAGRAGRALPDRVGVSAPRPAGRDRARVRYLAADPGPGWGARLGAGGDADGAPQLRGDRRGPHVAARSAGHVARGGDPQGGGDRADPRLRGGLRLVPASGRRFSRLAAARGILGTLPGEAVGN